MQGNPRRNWIAIGIVVAGLLFVLVLSDSPAGQKVAAESKARREREEKAKAEADARAREEYEMLHGKNMGSYKNKYTGDDIDVTKLPDGTLSFKNRRTGDTVVSSPTDGTYVRPEH